jgi:large subunit ribosomal protein L32e
MWRRNMKKPKFLRRNWSKRSRLGKNRKKLQVWRRATGRHNKIRKKRKGYPIKVMIGFREEKKGRGKIEDKKMILVNNIKELEKIQKGEIAVIAKVGERKRMEIAKKAKEKNIPVYNININKKLKKADKKKQKIETEKEKLKSSKKETKAEEKK